jgi:L-rhamnose isomerase/sugar isomerase
MSVYADKAQAKAILDRAAAKGLNPDQIVADMKAFAIETPSWAYADGGTRFGTFRQPAAAKTIEQKLMDAAMVHTLTGIAPTVAVHVLWDFPKGFDAKLVGYAESLGVKIGAINPTLFQDPSYKYGSLAARNDAARKLAVDHVLASIEIGKLTKSKGISLWLADGINFPGQDDISERRARLIDSLKKIYAALPAPMELWVEYKPFEPASYVTDIGDWGMASTFCQKLGDRAKVLVDIGHHFPAQNVEQIVAWLIEENRLGGFHLNDRKYADDDLTTASIDPYQVFRIFNELVSAAKVRTRNVDIAYMVDQSHTLKPKMEEMVQTVDVIHQMLGKALLVDRKTLAKAQAAEDIVLAEETLRDGFLTDTRPLVGMVREQLGINPDAIQTLRDSGYIAKAAKERA